MVPRSKTDSLILHAEAGRQAGRHLFRRKEEKRRGREGGPGREEEKKVLDRLSIGGQSVGTAFNPSIGESVGYFSRSIRPSVFGAACLSRRESL